ncbi:hypothetical protein [Pseudophaeobacter leonis]|uniref:hypothetical protein n=1 Tax=Pseudophaeobacter leonis TaxID=1144477 RepID=UPI001F4F0B8D|nr:hypothetical protein [Pseudophaeobacter leonis]
MELQDRMAPLVTSCGKSLAPGADQGSFRQMMRLLGHTAIFVFLTLLTQLGGMAWLFALLFRRRILMFVLTYSALTLAAHWATPVTGRVALSCHNGGSLQVQSWFYCITNRNYVTPELAAVLQEAAATLEREYPGTKTGVLDANFPFLTGFPLLPHLSHDGWGKGGPGAVLSRCLRVSCGRNALSGWVFCF